jgi:hypothetical protein
MKLIYSTPVGYLPPFLSKFKNLEHFQSFQSSINSDRVFFYYNTHQDFEDRNTDYWKYLEQHSDIKLIYDLHGEPSFRRSIFEIIDSIKEYNIDLSRVIIIAIDNAQKIHIEKLLREHKARAIRIIVWNHWLNTLNRDAVLPSQSSFRKTKFNFLLRRYAAWRLLLPIKLLERNILWDNFSFTCLASPESYSASLDSAPVEFALSQIQSLNESINSEGKEFLKKIPVYHNCKYTDIDVKKNDESKLIKLIKSSDFHLLIEKSYVHDWIDLNDIVLHNEDDGHFISEKTYRVLIANRPFIVYSTQDWLKRFKRQGYKTYSPFINEKYDDEFDNAKRLTMIVDEVERICKLPADEYAALVKECQLIADYNYNLVMELYNKEQNINLEQVLCKV